MILESLFLMQALPVPKDSLQISAFEQRQAYAECLQRETLSLEPSDAPFDDIFKAAKTACGDEWFAALSALKSYFDSKQAAASNQDVLSFAVESMTEFEDSEQDELRLSLLRARAIRKTE